MMQWILKNFGSWQTSSIRATIPLFFLTMDGAPSVVTPCSHSGFSLMFFMVTYITYGPVVLL